MSSCDLPPQISPYQKIFEEAVRNEDMLELEQILEDREGKININFFDKEGMTALHQSCQNGNLELVKLLVRFGADVKLASRDGWSAIHIAAFGGHRDIIVYLLHATGVTTSQ